MGGDKASGEGRSFDFAYHPLSAVVDERGHSGAPCAKRRAQRYHTPHEVAAHNTPDDCWVSVLGNVYDVTQVLKDNPGRLAAPIIAASGTDVSHWFDANTGDVRTYIDPDTQLRVLYCPQGEFVGIAPVAPCTDVDCGSRPPWWRDSTLRVGALSAAVRLVRVRNMLTGQEDVLEVPGEETLGEIERRYLAVNAHAASYTWKALVRHQGRGGGGGSGGAGAQRDWCELDMNATLEANGVPDERVDGLPGDEAIPVLHTYWNDDLTSA